MTGITVGCSSWPMCPGAKEIRQVATLATRHLVAFLPAEDTCTARLVHVDHLTPVPRFSLALSPRVHTMHTKALDELLTKPPRPPSDARPESQGTNRRCRLGHGQARGFCPKCQYSSWPLGNTNRRPTCRPHPVVYSASHHALRLLAYLHQAQVMM